MAPGRRLAALASDEDGWELASQERSMADARDPDVNRIVEFPPARATPGGRFLPGDLPFVVDRDLFSPARRGVLRVSTAFARPTRSGTTTPGIRSSFTRSIVMECTGSRSWVPTSNGESGPRQSFRPGPCRRQPCADSISPCAAAPSLRHSNSPTSIADSRRVAGGVSRLRVGHPTVDEELDPIAGSERLEQPPNFPGVCKTERPHRVLPPCGSRRFDPLATDV
jgi:hypothetical protein